MLSAANFVWRFNHIQIMVTLAGDMKSPNLLIWLILFILKCALVKLSQLCCQHMCSLSSDNSCFIHEPIIFMLAALKLPSFKKINSVLIEAINFLLTDKVHTKYHYGSLNWDTSFIALLISVMIFLQTCKHSVWT